MKTLTGKKRLREQKRLFRKSIYVLQVEERNVGSNMENMGSSIEFRDFDFTKFRDAKLEDFIDLGNIL